MLCWRTGQHLSSSLLGLGYPKTLGRRKTLSPSLSAELEGIRACKVSSKKHIGPPLHTDTNSTNKFKPGARLSHRQHVQLPSGENSCVLLLLRCYQNPEAAQRIAELFTNRKTITPHKFSEDCLYLNIYTPADLTKNSRLPVSKGTTGLDLWVLSSVACVPLERDKSGWGQHLHSLRLK